MPLTVFFFIALHIIAVIRMLMARELNIAASTTMSLLVASLILGKAVLITDLLPFINRFPQRPLVYNIAWKSAIYLVVAALVHYLERLIDFSRQAGGLAAGNEKLLAEQVWPHFWVVQIVLFILILRYCTARELVRAIGKDRAMRMFFGQLPPPAF